MEKRNDPSNPSGAYSRMEPAWEQIEDILDGPACIRAKRTKYLPKHESEDDAEYARRVAQAPWLPEFDDILAGLAAKPFAKDITFKNGAPPDLVTLAEDIDGRGNNLTAFCREVFRKGIGLGCHAILVDNTGTGSALTVAQERQQGVRPYWVSICADDIIDLKTAFVGAREVAYHVRIEECAIIRDGYAEIEKERIREFNREPALNAKGAIVSLGPPTWTLWEARVAAEGVKVWDVIDGGTFAPIDEIPLVFFWTGDREGPQYVRPPLGAIADKQIELYRVLSRKDEAYTKAGFPMLTANGLGPPTGGAKIEVGPGRILFAPAAQASWDYIQPNPEVLKELRADVESIRDDIRRLGMQPLTPQGGDVSATASSIEGARAHSRVQAWALGLKDVIEQALVLTAKWLRVPDTAEVTVHTDFLAGTMSQPGLDALVKARVAREISRVTYLEGLIRFGVLPGDYDIAADEEVIAEEMQGLALSDVPPLDPGTAPPAGA